MILAVGYFFVNSANMQTNTPSLYTIEVNANPNNILMGGDTSLISVQLYYNGAPSLTSGITVHFESSNPSAGSLASSTLATNSNGAVIQALTGGSSGSTIVRAYVDFGNSVIKEDSVQVTVLPWGKITGTVKDGNGNGIPNATVKLLTAGQLYASPENPQISSGRDIGKYSFNRIPYGQYTITAEKADASGINHQASNTVNLNADTATIDVIISDYPVSAAATPTPTPTPGPTAAPTAVPAATPTASPGSVTSDKTAPVTSLNLTGVSNANGDFSSNVICTLSAQDNPGGSGVSVTQYSFDGNVWNNYTNPFTVTQPGVTTIFYKSVDNNGNAEVAQVKSITISSGSTSGSPTQKTPAPSMATTIVSLVAVSMLLVLSRKCNKK